jgi:hypothetical protein
VDQAPGRPDDIAAGVEAAGGAAVAVGLADDRRVEPAVTPALADLVSLRDRRRTRTAAAPAVAALAAHAARVGQGSAAEAAARRAGPVGADPWAWAGPMPTPHSLAQAVEAAATDDPVACARAWLALRRALIAEDRHGLALLTEFATAWRGGVAEVHRLPTLAGRLSFAIRWHGYRPALLWQLERRSGDAVVPLRCPGLDPNWSSTEAAGEVLLAGTAAGLAPVPGEGDDFS